MIGRDFFSSDLPRLQYRVYRLPRVISFMKKLLTLVSLSCLLGILGCSRSDNEVAAKPSPTPNPNLQKDAERLQQATANIAKERERAAQSSPSPTP